mgnify:CR=1 FL=1
MQFKVSHLGKVWEIESDVSASSEHRYLEGYYNWPQACRVYMSGINIELSMFPPAIWQVHSDILPKKAHANQYIFPLDLYHIHIP